MRRFAVRLTVALALPLLGTGCAVAPSSRWQSRGDGTAPTVVDSGDCRYQARRQAALRFPHEPPGSPSRHRTPSPGDVVADSDRFAAENGFYAQCMRQKGFELSMVPRVPDGVGQQPPSASQRCGSDAILCGVDMTATDPMQNELEDLEQKLSSARDAAAAPGASEKDKADLKLIEQAYLAAEQKARRAPGGGNDHQPTDPKKKLDKKLDDALKGTFPGSDPISFVEAAPVKEEDHSLPDIKVAEQQAPGKTKAARKSK